MQRWSFWVRLLLVIVAILIGGSNTGTATATSDVDWSKLDPALAMAMHYWPHAVYPVIIEAGLPNEKVANSNERMAKSTGASRAKDAMELVHAVRGHHKNTLSLIGGSSADLDAEGIATLSRDPHVRQISLDRPIPAADSGSGLASVNAQLIRAPDVWALGYTGQGIGVAVVDSGVFATNDLAGRLVACVDLIDTTTACGADPGGHGTHVAGIVGGSGADSAANTAGAYKGIAPGANIISVRVINGTGSAPLSAVIKGIQWVVQNRKTYNIRVMNLSFGAPAANSYKNDPMVTAVEIAWLSGIVVVSAAGNSGPGASTINTPGIDPYSIAVGALDDNMTVDPGDDLVASFSSRGPTVDNISKPDLVAPGRRIISLFTASSYLANLLPDRITPTTAGANYFRLSGTSQAAPAVSGVAALLLQRNPALKPDQVKFILKKTVRELSGVNANTGGKGVVDAYAAVTSSLVDKDNRGGRPSNGFAVNILPLIKGTQPLTWKDPYYMGRNWTNLTWDNLTWDNLTWDNFNWDNLTWDNLTWDNLTWDNLTWDTNWSSTTWDSVPWQSTKHID